MINGYRSARKGERKKENQMALIKCSECGKEISDKALTCPEGGSPKKKVEKDIENRG